MQAEELLREGRLAEAIVQLQQQVRADPAKPELRAFLFQLLALTGRWDRALTQLNVAAEMDAGKLLLAEICRPALSCEALRAEVFAGRRLPLVFGQPQEWAGWLVRANQLAGQGQDAAAGKLREQALEAAPAVDGMIDDKPFEWIMDMDGRLGPILEAIVDGKYFWVPFTRIRAVQIEEPSSLRDLLWVQAQFTWTNGGRVPGLIPTRYAGSEASDDDLLRLARKTDWVERAGGLFVGLGQRMLATDQGEYSLLEVRKIVLNNAMEAPAEETGPAVDASVNLAASAGNRPAGPPPGPPAKPPPAREGADG